MHVQGEASSSSSSSVNRIVRSRNCSSCAGEQTRDCLLGLGLLAECLARPASLPACWSRRHDALRRKDPQHRMLVVESNLYEPFEDKDRQEFRRGAQRVILAAMAVRHSCVGGFQQPRRAAQPNGSSSVCAAPLHSTPCVEASLADAAPGRCAAQAVR